MAADVMFIHGAGALGHIRGEASLSHALRQALETSDHRFFSPRMPNPDNPEYEPWKTTILSELNTLDSNVILVGHSLGGSVLLKMLSEETSPNIIAGLCLVAVPYWGIDDDWDNEEYILPTGFESKLDAIPHLFLYHSRDDPIVPYDHAVAYAKKLPRATFRTIDGDRHRFERGLASIITDISTMQV